MMVEEGTRERRDKERRKEKITDGRSKGTFLSYCNSLKGKTKKGNKMKTKE